MMDETIRVFLMKLDLLDEYVEAAGAELHARYLGADCYCVSGILLDLDQAVGMILRRADELSRSNPAERARVGRDAKGSCAIEE